MLVAAVAVVLSAGCSGDATPNPDAPMTTASANPVPTSTQSPPMPAPSDEVAPSLLGMRWPEALSRGSAAGLSVIPNLTGPPGPLTPDCVVVQQSPLPGEPLMAPVINALVQCPTQPGPNDGTNFPTPIPAPS